MGRLHQSRKYHWCQHSSKTIINLLYGRLLSKFFLLILLFLLLVWGAIRDKRELLGSYIQAFLWSRKGGKDSLNYGSIKLYKLSEDTMLIVFLLMMLCYESLKWAFAAAYSEHRISTLKLKYLACTFKWYK